MVGMDDDQTGQSAGTGTQSGTDPATSTADTSASATSAPSGTDPSGKPPVTREDFDRIQNQLRAADQRRAAAEKKAQDLEDAKLSETERTVKQLDEARAQNAQLMGQIKDLQIQNAFVTDNTHDWHDSRAAMKLADLSGVTIDDDGTVKGLKEALEAVAKSAPYLLKPKADASAEGAGSQAAQQQTGVTGVAGGGNGSTGNDKAGLAKRFPQLAGRVSS
jgi:hypothetical protein